MTAISFRPGQSFTPVVDRRFVAAERELRRWLADVCRSFDIQHVGSTAVPARWCRGNVDLQIRVAKGDFRVVADRLSQLFAISDSQAHPTGRSADWLIWDDLRSSPSLRVHLTTYGGAGETLWKARECLTNDADLKADYDHLKRSCSGQSLPTYRQAQMKFFSELAQSDAYQRLVHREPEPYFIEIETERLRLTTPLSTDVVAMAEYYRQNLTHLSPWEPAGIERRTTESFWSRRLRDGWLQRCRRREVTFLFRLKAPDTPSNRPRNGGCSVEPILGTCRFSNVVPDPFRACFLGYSIAATHEGQGFMSEGLTAAIQFVFGTWGLHRIMANYIPSNIRSAKLLERLGFDEEGYAKDYLFINGSWRDHVLTARINADSPPCTQSAPHSYRP